MRFGKLITFCASIFLLLNIVPVTPVTPVSASLFSDKDIKSPVKPITNSLVTLTEDNFVVLRGAIDEDSASYFIKDIYRLVVNEKNNDDIYVYLMTPGGSVIHGYDIIQTLEALSQTGKKIHCIADTAYSMGFSILQACDYRHVIKSSSIMQHQMSFGFEGQMENNKNRFKFIESIEEKMTEQQSARLGLSQDEFKKKILSDWWMFSDNAVKENAADDIVNVLCDKSLTNETYFREFNFVFFGKVKFEFSKCPLIKSPISIDFMDKKGSTKNEEDDFDYTSNDIASKYINPEKYISK